MIQATTPTSTIVQMLYAVPPRLDIAGLMAQLRRMVPEGHCPSARLAQVGDDTAHLDLAMGRFTLALRRDVSRAIGACLTVAVGPSPESQRSALPAALEAADQARLARTVTEAISARFAPNQTIWHITPMIVSSSVINDLQAALPAELPNRQAEVDAVDMSRVLAQIEISLAGKRAPMPMPAQRTAGQGFARHWPRGKMAMSPARPGQPQPAITALQAPANSLPTLPRPNDAGRQRTHAMLAGHQPHIGLTLRYGAAVHTIALSRAG